MNSIGLFMYLGVSSSLLAFWLSNWLIRSISMHSSTYCKLMDAYPKATTSKQTDKLTVNPSKTKFILFGSRQRLTNNTTSGLEQDFCLKLGRQIDRVTHTKFLGLVLDENLKALSHYCVSHKRMPAYEKYYSYAGVR